MAKKRFREIKHGRLPTGDRGTGEAENRAPENIAGKLDRTKAFITDSFMLLMPIMYLVFYAVLGSREEFAQNKLIGWIYIIVPYIMVSAIFIAKTGQTPGMRAYDIKVVRASDGSRMDSVSLIVLRQILGVVDFMLFGWLTMFFRKDCRTPHEMLTNSTMIKTTPAK